MPSRVNTYPSQAFSGGGVEFLDSVVRRNSQDLDAVQMDHVARPHEVVHIGKLLSHGGRSDDDGVGLTDPGDVVFGEVVVVGMGEKDVVRNALFRYSPGIDVQLDPAPANPNRRLPKPGDAFEHCQTRGGKRDQRGAENVSAVVVPKKADIMTGGLQLRHVFALRDWQDSCKGGQFWS